MWWGIYTPKCRSSRILNGKWKTYPRSIDEWWRKPKSQLICTMPSCCENLAHVRAIHHILFPATWGSFQKAIVCSFAYVFTICELDTKLIVFPSQSFAHPVDVFNTFCHKFQNALFLSEKDFICQFPTFFASTLPRWSLLKQ